MRYTAVLALAAVSSAFILPSEQVFADIAIENNDHKESWYEEAISVKDSVLSSFKKHFEDASESTKEVWSAAAKTASNALDDALKDVDELAHDVNDRIHETAFDANAWLQSEVEDLMIDEDEEHDGPPPPPHARPGPDGRRPPPPPGRHEDGPDGKHRPPPPPPPHDGPAGEHPPPPPPPPHHGPEEKRPPPPPHDGPEGRRPPHHKRPHKHHGKHGKHGRPNATVYEIIANSKYTKQLAFLINQYPDLVEALNGTEANFTIFAPTDRAFEKIPKHAPKPSKEQIKALLSYHVVPAFYPAGRVLVTHTVPTLLNSSSLGPEPLPQRLRLHLGFNGLTVNFYSKIIAIDIFGSNGVIHGVNSLIIPPPPVAKIIDLLPAEFSTLELALVKTGLYDKLNSTDHNGGTLFAPSNRAFGKLGPRINAFLFSERGLKYLKALLEYHVVPDNTLYSDAFYHSEQADAETIPRGQFHLDLPTLLKDRKLSIDVGRLGGLIDIKINGFSRVVVQDGVARDGVIQIPGNVLIPPRGSRAEDVEEPEEDDSEMDLEEFKERLLPSGQSKWDL